MIHTINEKSPAQCGSIDEVRAEIDRLDRAIIQLLATRLGYVHRVVDYKQPTPEAIIDEERRQAVLATRRQWASQAGISPQAIEQMYSHLIQYFIDEERKLKNL